MVIRPVPSSDSIVSPEVNSVKNKARKPDTATADREHECYIIKWSVACGL